MTILLLGQVGSGNQAKPSETKPYYPGHPLMPMVRSARKQSVRAVFVASPEMREKHPLLLKSDFFSWAPIVDENIFH